jgi:hypothetical protein
MSYGFDLGRLRTDSTGLSYVDRFTYTGGTINRVYSSEAFEFATGAQSIILPQSNTAANTIPIFPTITTSLSVANKQITVIASGGNVVSDVLVFVR